MSYTPDTTTWFHAAETGNIAKIREMIVMGIDVMMRDSQERTAFHIACQNKYTDIMTTILAAKQMAYLKSLGMDIFATTNLSSQTSTTSDRRHA